KPNLALSIKQLKITISSWCLARRLPIAIDYDLARIVAAANPQLLHGKFILELTERKNTLRLFGAIKKTTEVTHLDDADVSMYVPDQIRSDLANRDYLILIQADGRTIKTPIAYWNKAHQEAMPGSQLFIPFSQSLLQPEFAIINQQIMSLALNRLQQ
ncbi:MAG: capsule biosynthesis GfcC family protein, partial [Sinobacterium sp.]